MVNVIKNHTLFPTVILEFEHIANEQLLNAVQNEDVKSEMVYHTGSSVDNNLHKKPEYKTLVDKIIDSTKEVSKLYEYQYTDIEITSLWVNISPKGSAHSVHNHSNNTFSGVYYPIESKSQTPIMFQDPRPAVGVWAPRRNKANELTATLRAFEHKKNMGLIFPAWLMHFVPPVVSSRISISWNVLLRGEYGEPNTLQNAHI